MYFKDFYHYLISPKMQSIRAFNRRVFCSTKFIDEKKNHSNLYPTRGDDFFHQFIFSNIDSPHNHNINDFMKCHTIQLNQFECMPL